MLCQHECFCRNQASEQLASAAWINPELGVEFGVANQFKPPASIRITHRNIDWHSMRLILFALTCGLPIGQRHDVIGFAHADHVMRLCRVIKLMVDCVDFEPQSSWLLRPCTDAYRSEWGRGQGRLTRAGYMPSRHFVEIQSPISKQHKMLFHYSPHVILTVNFLASSAICSGSNFVLSVSIL